MLTKEIKEALMGYTANMSNDVHFVVQTGEGPAELCGCMGPRA